MQEDEMPPKTQSRNVVITNATIRSLKAGDSDWFIRDSSIAGFQIKVPPSGNAIYQVEARLGGTGKVKKFKIGSIQDTPLPKAKTEALIALKKIRSGIDPLQEKHALLHEGKTLNELIEDYYHARDLKDRTLRDYRYIASRRFAHWLDRRVVDITKHEIRDWYIRGRGTPTQTEQAYRFLNALMTYAKGLEIITENPCHLVTDGKMRYTIRKKDTHIEVNQDLSKFLIALKDYQFNKDSERVSRDLILLILTTGLRSIEARSLEWANVNFDRKTFTIPDPKNKRPHTVPMNQFTYALFRYREEYSEGSRYVFRIKGESKSGYMTDFQKTLTNICNKAEVDNVTPHDLRRTFATVLNTLGVGYADIKQLMNHKARDITADIYIQPDIGGLRRTLQRVVDFYDRKVPCFDQGMPMGEGLIASRYTTGTLRYLVYGRGMPLPEELKNATDEDPGYIRESERDYWEN